MRSISPYERFGEAVPQTDAALREHVFAEGDTLPGLAHRYLGDWRLWRVIAERSGVADPRRVEVGTAMLIPERSLEGGGFERV